MAMQMGLDRAEKYGLAQIYEEDGARDEAAAIAIITALGLHDGRRPRDAVAELLPELRRQIAAEIAKRVR